MTHKWETALFPGALVDGGPGYRLGCIWKSWSIVYLPDRWYRVIHYPSRRRLTEFDRLRCARRFCEEIDPLTDWSVKEPPEHDQALKLAVHRAALRVTGGKPEFAVIQGGAP